MFGKKKQQKTLTQKMEYCPNCEATLKDHLEFDNGVQRWKCTVCGQTFRVLSRKYKRFIKQIALEFMNGNRSRFDKLSAQEEEDVRIKSTQLLRWNLSVDDEWGWACWFLEREFFNEKIARLKIYEEEYEPGHLTNEEYEPGHLTNGEYCPNCEAELKDQPGFDNRTGYWKCTACGQILLNPNDYIEGSRFDDVLWFCDVCNASLNRQPGFSDLFDTWACTECGYKNNISEDEIFDDKAPKN